MIATVSPSIENCEHTLNTLRYAQRLKDISEQRQYARQQPPPAAAATTAGRRQKQQQQQQRRGRHELPAAEIEDVTEAFDDMHLGADATYVDDDYVEEDEDNEEEEEEEEDEEEEEEEDGIIRPGNRVRILKGKYCDKTGEVRHACFRSFTCCVRPRLSVTSPLLCYHQNVSFSAA